MGKIKRSGKVATPRAESTARSKATEDHSTHSFMPKRLTSRRVSDSRPREEKLTMPGGDEGILDEWLEPDEDTDLDQWLHDHGGDSGLGDPDR